MGGILLDTVVASVLSPFKRPGPQRVKYETAARGHSLAISMQSLAELYLWAESNNWGAARRQMLQTYIDNQFTVLPCDSELATAWAKVMNQSAAAGRPLQSADAWVAATAIFYGLDLLTHDKDFAGLKISGLKIICFA